jgi:hypothetical protein
VLRVYLQIYIEHGKRLARVARFVPANRDPTLLSSQNTFLRIAFALVLSLLLPLTLSLFAWKAGVFPIWGSGLLCVAAAVIAGHVMLRFHGVSWRTKVLLSVGVALLAVTILAGGAELGLGPPRRSFDLFRANLSGQWLVFDDLSGANLGDAKLSGATLAYAILDGANLIGADLSGANLSQASLSGADLGAANLTNANLSWADLRDAHLNQANLSGANLSGPYLGQKELDQACGTEVKLPPGLTVKPCPRNWPPVHP